MEAFFQTSKAKFHKKGPPNYYKWIYHLGSRFITLITGNVDLRPRLRRRFDTSAVDSPVAVVPIRALVQDLVDEPKYPSCRRGQMSKILPQK